MKIEKPFLHITSTAGRIGRIYWTNSERSRASRDQRTWGHLFWDRYWPEDEPFFNGMAAAVQQLAAAFRALSPTVAAASLAFEKLSKVWMERP
jgi:hypothetical protein